MDQALFERVCNTPGVSGFEDAVQDVASDALGECCDEVRRDRMGNVIGRRKATHPPDAGKPGRILIAAHADEVGMMVKHIDEKGFLRFQPLGGLNPQVVVSQRVLIHGRELVRGVIVPDTRKDSRDKPTPLEEAFIDTGLPPEVVSERIEIGDVISFDENVGVLNDKMYVGRNFDDRIGTYCLLEAMRQVGETRIDAYAVSSVQEEVGVRGATVAAFAVEPDIGIAIDGSLAWGPYIGEHQNLCAPGEGTGIYVMDRLTIGDRRLVRFLLELCERRGITVQKNIGGGTDASAIQRSRAGALTTTIGAPVRYMHSTVQLCHADDIEATTSLLVAIMEHGHELLAQTS